MVEVGIRKMGIKRDLVSRGEDGDQERFGIKNGKWDWEGRMGLGSGGGMRLVGGGDWDPLGMQSGKQMEDGIRAFFF